MTLPATRTDLAPLLERLFLFDAFEGSYEVTGIRGRIPEWLRGRYLINGPARFERAGRRYKHWLDGDGMVCSLEFSNDGVRLTSRFVQTTKLRDEEEAGEFLYRGFGTSFSGDRLRRKVMLEPPVNVSVYPYNGRLLAFGEQTLPYELDPVTLETRGEYDFCGKLNEVTPFAAHAKFDGHLMNFGISFSPTQPMLNVYEFDATAELIRRRRHALRYQHSVHDFGFTPQHIVFFLTPLLMNFSRFWGEGASVMESLSWEPDKGSIILVAPRAGSSADAFSLDAGNGYCLHLINCFEEGNRLYVDMLELDEPVYREYEPIPDLFSTVSPGRPVRFVIDLEKRVLLERLTLDYERSPDFPSVDYKHAGTRRDDFWVVGMSEWGKPGRKFFDELVHGSWKNMDISDIYRVPKGEYLGGEPAYIGHGEEGVVIAQHFMPETESTEFLLFDAAAVRNGPIARLPLKHRLHPGFHTAFWKARQPL